MPSNHLTLCHPFLLLPSIFPSISVFSSELALCIRWPKYWSFSISPSNEYSELISFRTDSIENHIRLWLLLICWTSPFLSFLIWKMRLIVIPTSWELGEDALKSPSRAWSVHSKHASNRNWCSCESCLVGILVQTLDSRAWALLLHDQIK